MTDPGFEREVSFSLRLTPLFSGLSDADLEILLAGARIEVCPDGHVLFQEGARADAFFALLEGHVEVFIEGGEGRHKVIDILKPPATLAEAAIFGDGRYPTSARVLGGVRLLVIPTQPFLAKLDERFDLVLHMLSSMSYRLRVQVRHIAELKLKTTAQRLGGFLLSLTEAENGPAKVRFPYDKRLVAQNLGMKPESLSRALARLGAAGVASGTDNTVAIADIGRLRRFCVEDGME